MSFKNELPGMLDLVTLRRVKAWKDGLAWMRHKNEYHIHRFWSGEARCWIADIPDLKFRSAPGETAAEALREVFLAKEAWLARRRAHQQPIPKPLCRPAICA